MSESRREALRRKQEAQAKAKRTQRIFLALSVNDLRPASAANGSRLSKTEVSQTASPNSNSTSDVPRARSIRSCNRVKSSKCSPASLGVFRRSHSRVARWFQ